jgi:hypothetical protein
MKEENVLVQCRFDLTDSEIAGAARKRAALETEIAKVDSAFNVEREKHKKALGTLEGQAGALADLIRKGYEMRETECRVEYDYQAGLVSTVRVDTREVVKTRPMSDTEKGEGPPLPLGPSILLSESDPDAKAAKDCGVCGHLAVYHEPGGCILPTCECKAFVTFSKAAPAELVPAAAEDALACVRCGHSESVHGEGRERACMVHDCACGDYVHPDPLGVAEVGREIETREPEL